MTGIPSPPSEALRATADVYLRFEDVSQDGRLVLEAIPNALGPAVWRAILAHDPSVRALFVRGIVPVLSRFLLEGKAGPVSANAVLRAEGACHLSRASDGRLVVDMWADLFASLGHTYDHGELLGAVEVGKRLPRSLVGRVFGEHVLTRPFAAAGERRVRDLDFPGAPPVRGSREALPGSETLSSLPEGATPLEPAMRLDSVPLTFGLVHTDSNRHVNSLVYLRLFEEAALRRFVALGRGASVLGRSIDIAYRKPCFAGQTMRVFQRAFMADGHLGVASTLVDENDAATEETLSQARAHAYARIMFD